MGLLSLDDATALPMAEARRLYRQHINPGLLDIYDILGTSDLDVASAQGCELTLTDGTTVLDFSSAIGVLGLGHNHPRIVAAEALCHRERLLDALKVGPMKLQAALAHNIAELLPTPLAVCSFAVSGAEAVEAAMKCAERAQGPARRHYLTTTGAFHGKTHGALSVTRTEGFAEGFLLGIPPEHVTEIPHGVAGELESAIAQRRRPDGTNDIVALIIEPMQGQSLQLASAEYLEQVVALCRSNAILTIFDEVKVGMYRTGPFCAFQVATAVPDFVTLSKALGGGKRAMAAMVTSASLFDRAYGQRKKDASLHTSTFAGLGGSCAVAIETLNVMNDTGFREALTRRSRYLGQGLDSLRARFPDQIHDVRGRGLLRGVRFAFAPAALERFAGTYLGQAFSTYSSVMMAALVSELYTEHRIITHFAASDPDVLHVMPPLIVSEHQIDRFCSALAAILGQGFMRTAQRFVARNAKARLGGSGRAASR